MNLIDMDGERRRRREPPRYDGLACSCGEAWFTLEGLRPAVCLDIHGRIVGYHGRFACTNCGQDPSGRPRR